MLALVPAEARIVASLDLEGLRGKPIWKELAAGPAKEAAILLDGFAKGTGVDPLQQIRQVLIATPGERQNDDRFVLVATLDRLDRARATAWLRQRESWTTVAFVHGKDTIVIAKGAWAATVEAQALHGGAAGSAASDPELRRLCERAAAGHVLWLAAIVPTTLRREMIEQVRFPDLASLSRLWTFIDVDRGLRAEMVAELSNEADARSLAHRLGAYLNAIKRHPDMLAGGFSPYLEAMRLAARGPRLHTTLDLSEGQISDLNLRLRELLRVGWMPR
jgi:hypothetical protein